MRSRITILFMLLALFLSSGISVTGAEETRQDLSRYYSSETFPSKKHLAALRYDNCTFSRTIGKHKNPDGSYTVLFLYQIRSRDGSTLYEGEYPADMRIWKLDTGIWVARSLKLSPVEEYQIVPNVK